MASVTTLLIVLLICILSPASLSQTISTCAPMLLPLTPCAPFVQGLSEAPTKSCCDNLDIVYEQHPECLCLLLNSTSVSVLPINATLALQLPLICSLNLSASTCSSSGGLSVPPASAPPPSEVSLGAPNNSTVAASPMVTVPPKRGIIMGYGFRPSDGMKLGTGGDSGRMIIVAFAAVNLLFIY